MAAGATKQAAATGRVAAASACADAPEPGRRRPLRSGHPLSGQAREGSRDSRAGAARASTRLWRAGTSINNADTVLKRRSRGGAYGRRSSAGTLQIACKTPAQTAEGPMRARGGGGGDPPTRAARRRLGSLGGVGWCSSSPAVPARRRGYVRLQGIQGGALDLLPFIIGRRITNPDPAYPVTRETLKRRGSLRRTRPKHHQWRAVVLFITAPVFCLKVARRAGARVSV